MTLEQLDALERMIRDPDSAPVGPQNIVTLREAALATLRLARAGLRLRASLEYAYVGPFHGAADSCISCGGFKENFGHEPSCALRAFDEVVRGK